MNWIPYNPHDTNELEPGSHYYVAIRNASGRYYVDIISIAVPAGRWAVPTRHQVTHYMPVNDAEKPPDLPVDEAPQWYPWGLPVPFEVTPGCPYLVVADLGRERLRGLLVWDLLNEFRYQGIKVTPTYVAIPPTWEWPGWTDLEDKHPDNGHLLLFVDGPIFGRRVKTAMKTDKGFDLPPGVAVLKWAKMPEIDSLAEQFAKELKKERKP